MIGSHKSTSVYEGILRAPMSESECCDQFINVVLVNGKASLLNEFKKILTVFWMILKCINKTLTDDII